MGRIEKYYMSKKLSIRKMNEIENTLSNFWDQQKISLTVPVDVFELATQLGFDVRAVDFSGTLEGLILVNELSKGNIGGFNSNKIIAYRVNASVNEAKFIVAHELSHYINEKMKNDHEEIVVAARDHEKNGGNDAEQEIDYMAAAILMPKNDMISKYKDVRLTRDDRFFERLAEEYKVDKKVAQRRIDEVFDVR